MAGHLRFGVGQGLDQRRLSRIGRTDQHDLPAPFAFDVVGGHVARGAASGALRRRFLHFGELAAQVGAQVVGALVLGHGADQLFEQANTFLAGIRRLCSALQPGSTRPVDWWAWLAALADGTTIKL